MTIRDGIRLGLGLTVVAFVFGMVDVLVASSTTEPTERMIRMAIVGVIAFVGLFVVSMDRKAGLPSPPRP